MSFHFDFVISQGLFLKLLGVNYFCAFLSLLLQIKGLYGVKGISPIADLLRRVRVYGGGQSFKLIPTLFWINSSDRSLLIAAWIGVFASLGCVSGFYPCPLLAILWLIYFSFYQAGSPFLNYQWDVLLLEIGAIGILYAVQSPPPAILVILLWVLLFRFIFASGFLKLVWGSKEWKDLTAMMYHYETQPLPTILAYYLHQLPRWFSKVSTLIVFFLELIVPFFIFTPEPLRLIACGLIIWLQIMIQATGNYTFFNILTVALCLPLISDHFLEGFKDIANFTPLFSENIGITVILSIIGALLIVVNIVEIASLFVQIPIFRKLLEPFQRCCIAAPYGLFVRMTTERHEIIIEGSNDMQEWKEYEFKWKPGNVNQAPRFVAPHQPRLDWQLWFAALTDYRTIPWYSNFILCLLRGSEDVLCLMKTNPFPDAPPKYIRAILYRYRFSDLAAKRATGAWWTRTYVGLYSPSTFLKY